MVDQELPPDLRELECQIRQRPAPESGAAFRARVLNAVKAEQNKAGRGRNGFWQFAAASAAAVFLWLNLSLIAVSDTELRAADGGSAAENRAAVEQLRELMPELTEQDAQRQVLLLQARARGILAPAPQARLKTSL